MGRKPRVIWMYRKNCLKSGKVAGPGGKLLMVVFGSFFSTGSTGRPIPGRVDMTKDSVGVHPSAGYYSIDAQGIVEAYENGIVFNGSDMNRLITTALAENRYWTALVAYHTSIQNSFESSNQPGGWNGLQSTPRYLAMQKSLLVPDVGVGDTINVQIGATTFNLSKSG